ncbi:MAG: GTPase HflX [Candidatus Omnitrophica bacterium]|nr:GTPase HflX [Candidatus Omnitrophota bacterium]MBU1932965.1 GTPase HflX [Candidatus Omnitrophota bacterium]
MEKAILVTVDFRDGKKWAAEDRAKELKELVRSSGSSVEEEIVSRREAPTPDLFIGKGKYEELIRLAGKKKIDMVVFNNELTPTQLRNLEKGLRGIKVIDRTQLILDIFARHARSAEGKIQVELAQLEYLLPRLTGRGVHLSRLGGGIGTRGPGEQVLESDKRRIRQQISRLKTELKDLEKRRSSLRKRRKDAMLATVAIIGYTNAGKTTLLNKLTDSGKIAVNKLFSTLDPVGRTYKLPNNLRILFHDTVGFLYELPHFLVESFKATLEEVKEADLLVHVLDASNPRVHDLDGAVYTVLKELGAENKVMINALNKIDLVENANSLNRLKKEFNNPVLISALRGDGIDAIIERISEVLSGLVTRVKIEIPVNKMDILSMIYEHGKVHKREDRSESVYIEATIPVKLRTQIDKLKLTNIALQ